MGCILFLFCDDLHVEARWLDISESILVGKIGFQKTQATSVGSASAHRSQSFAVGSLSNLPLDHGIIGTLASGLSSS